VPSLALQDTSGKTPIAQDRLWWETGREEPVFVPRETNAQLSWLACLLGLVVRNPGKRSPHSTFSAEEAIGCQAQRPETEVQGRW
jgi:hypothetical protein